MMLTGSVNSTTGRLAGAAFLAFFLLIGCGGDDSTPVTPTALTTAAAYTERGWERFEAANYSGALDDFSQAIVLDATYGEAHAGQGWTHLARATSSIFMQTAVTSFASAMDNGENGAYVLAGRAAANLGAGGASLDAAVADALAALAADGTFVFSHRTSFNADDLRLIQAFARAAQGDFSGALDAADLVLLSGIDEGSTGTWSVDGTTYDSFNGAVLAHLHKLSEQYSG